MAGTDAPDAPQIGGMYDAEGRGTWYVGARPESGREQPVIVFVPGLGSPASSYWQAGEFGPNRMYETAWREGFRTAFVGFMAKGEKAQDMWHNGRILAWQLGEICRYYGEKSVVLVAHSKGGVDAETAVVYFGAGPMVRRIITLSTPHWGSQLADIAYSSFGWPLAKHLGVHSPGCYVMQTGYMREFRRLTDKSPAAGPPLLPVGGDGSAPPLTKIWAGSQVLSPYGENDGVVTVRSAHHPRHPYVATLHFNHAQMQQGQHVWPFVQALALGLPLPAVPAMARPAPEPQAVPAGMILRGGVLGRDAPEGFRVDSSVKAMEVAVMASGGRGGELAGLAVIAPDGRVWQDFRPETGFPGASAVRVRIPAPPPGEWQIRVPPRRADAGESGYFAMVRLERSGAGGTAAAAGLRSVCRVLRLFPERYELVAEKQSNTGELPELPSDDGVYSIETQVSGTLPDGTPFERDCVRPLLIRRR